MKDLKKFYAIKSAFFSYYRNQKFNNANEMNHVPIDHTAPSLLWEKISHGQTIPPPSPSTSPRNPTPVAYCSAGAVCSAPSSVSTSIRFAIHISLIKVTKPQSLFVTNTELFEGFFLTQASLDAA